MQSSRPSSSCENVESGFVKEPTLRPATLDDAALASDLMTAAYPELPEDPVLTRYRWEHPRDRWSHGRFIAELDGRPVALVGWSHGPWDQSPEHNCYVEVQLDRAMLAADLLSWLWTWVGRDAQADGARILEAFAVEDEREVLESLRLLGYEHDRTGKVWELDLSAHGLRSTSPRPTRSSRRPLRTSSSVSTLPTGPPTASGWPCSTANRWPPRTFVIRPSAAMSGPPIRAVIPSTEVAAWLARSSSRPSPRPPSLGCRGC